MPFLKRTGWSLSVVVVATGAALVLDSRRALPDGGSPRGTVREGTSGQATGKTPPIPDAGPLAGARSLHQVGLPAELTREVIPQDNPQTPEKIALGQKLFFDGRLSADPRTAQPDPRRAGSAAARRLAVTSEKQRLSHRT